jgi:hypothetical protein
VAEKHSNNEPQPEKYDLDAFAAPAATSELSMLPFMNSVTLLANAIPVGPKTPNSASSYVKARSMRSVNGAPSMLPQLNAKLRRQWKSEA